MKLLFLLSLGFCFSLSAGAQSNCPKKLSKLFKRTPERFAGLSKYWKEVIGSRGLRIFFKEASIGPRGYRLGNTLVSVPGENLEEKVNFVRRLIRSRSGRTHSIELGRQQLDIPFDFRPLNGPLMKLSRDRFGRPYELSRPASWLVGMGAGALVIGWLGDDAVEFLKSRIDDSVSKYEESVFVAMLKEDPRFFDIKQSVDRKRLSQTDALFKVQERSSSFQTLSLLIAQEIDLVKNDIDFEKAHAAIEKIVDPAELELPTALFLSRLGLAQNGIYPLTPAYLGRDLNADLGSLFRSDDQNPVHDFSNLTPDTLRLVDLLIKQDVLLLRSWEELIASKGEVGWPKNAPLLKAKWSDTMTNKSLGQKLESATRLVYWHYKFSTWSSFGLFPLDSNGQDLLLEDFVQDVLGDY